MNPLLLSILFLSPLFALFSSSTPTAPEVDYSAKTVVNVRIEGVTRTVYEGVVFTDGHTITTPSGGTHKCDGTNGGASGRVIPVATSALDDAAKMTRGLFKYDGTWDGQYDDYSITAIGPDVERPPKYWVLFVNYQMAMTTGCQTPINFNDSLLWAFDAYGTDPLHLIGPIQTRIGSTVTFLVYNGATSNPVQGATVMGGTTNNVGQVSINFPRAGTFRFKATKSGSIRSNLHELLVLNDRYGSLEEQEVLTAA